MNVTTFSPSSPGDVFRQTLRKHLLWGLQFLFPNYSYCLHEVGKRVIYTRYLNKKGTGTNMPISLKLDKHLNNFWVLSVRGLAPLSNGTKKCRFCHVS